MSISPILYEQLFHTKVFLCGIYALQFGFVIFWRKDFGAKAAHKMLAKLTSGHKILMEVGDTGGLIVGNPLGLFRSAAQASPSPLIKCYNNMLLQL